MAASLSYFIILALLQVHYRPIMLEVMGKNACIGEDKCQDDDDQETKSSGNYIGSVRNQFETSMNAKA